MPPTVEPITAAGIADNPEHEAADRIEGEARHEGERTEREHERQQGKTRKAERLPLLRECV